MPGELEDLKDHCHTPLTSEDAIRVLELLPSRKARAPIKCTLREVSLSTPQTEYEALSYVWGSPEGTQPISCDGMKLLVTPNCLDALVHLRLRSGTRTLWIDAICINQRHETECNHQVGRMGEVYSKALRVIVWFGLADAFTPGLIKYSRYQHLWLKIPDTAVCKPLWWVFCRMTRHSGKKIRDAEHRTQQHAWFRRLWTVQEVAFAREATVMIGPYTMEWDKFCDSFGQSEAAGSRWRAKRLVSGDFAPAPILSDLLRNLSHLDCKLAHDRIFGVYSVLISAGLDLPPPDYSRPMSIVFQEVVAAFVHVTEMLTPLRMTLPADSSEGLPSWVPNWLAYFPESLLGPTDGEMDTLGTFERRGHRWKAAPFWAQAAHFDIVRGTLLLKGKHISKIKQRLSHIPQDPRDGVGLDQHDGLVKVCQQWCRSLHLSQGESATKAAEWLIECISGLWSIKPRYIGIEGWFHVMLHPDVEQAASIAAAEATRPGYLQHPLGAPNPCLSSSNISEITSYLDTSFRFIQPYVRYGAHYAFITLDSGHYGRAHYSCQEGDDVYLFAGCGLPLVLRSHGDAFRLVAPAYILGVMDGELWPDDESTLENITLV